MRLIKKTVIDWLLGDDNPPVKYLTLTNILHKKHSDPLVADTKRNLMTYSVTQKILQHHHEFQKVDDKAYQKYTGMYWQIIFLGQFLADGHDPLLAPIIEDLLNNRQWISAKGGQCLTANLLTALIRLGYAEHPVVTTEVEILARRYLNDGGITCTVMDYSLLPQCYMALPKLLLCFSHFPEKRRAASVSEAIEHISAELIKHFVYKYVPENKKSWNEVLESAPKKTELPPSFTVKGWIADKRKEFIENRGFGPRTVKHGWLKFGFPLHYNSDLLEANYALAHAGVKMHANLQDALQIISSKKNAQGKWLLENSLNGKMWADVEEPRKPSKWITYFAIYVLSHF